MESVSPDVSLAPHNKMGWIVYSGGGPVCRLLLLSSLLSSIYFQTFLSILRSSIKTNLSETRAEATVRLY
jgi:hypothetical protein